MFDLKAFLAWDYETFLLFVDGCNVSEVNYPDRMKLLKELGIPNPEDYEIEYYG